jgi:hypothetical protein
LELAVLVLLQLVVEVHLEVIPHLVPTQLLLLEVAVVVLAMEQLALMAVLAVEVAEVLLQLAVELEQQVKEITVVLDF